MTHPTGDDVRQPEWVCVGDETELTNGFSAFARDIIDEHRVNPNDGLLVAYRKSDATLWVTFWAKHPALWDDGEKHLLATQYGLALCCGYDFPIPDSSELWSGSIQVAVIL